jgi:hypothetical protein
MQLNDIAVAQDPMGLQRNTDLRTVRTVPHVRKHPSRKREAAPAKAKSKLHRKAPHTICPQPEPKAEVKNEAIDLSQ